ncbi:MAG: hypothetical protein ABIN61_09260 [candidate division WOR-3 bacterium]
MREVIKRGNINDANKFELIENRPTKRSKLENFERKNNFELIGNGEILECSVISGKTTLSSKAEIKPIIIMKNDIKKHFLIQMELS